MMTIGTQVASKAPGWNGNCPIPTDPCFEDFEAGIKKQTKPYKIKNPIPTDSGHGSSSARSNRPGKFLIQSRVHINIVSKRPTAGVARYTAGRAVVVCQSNSYAIGQVSLRVFLWKIFARRFVKDCTVVIIATVIFLASPKPRVKPEALAIARNNQGKELAYLFNPAMKIIPIGVRPSKN